jgi:hypothetical protein
MPNFSLPYNNLEMQMNATFDRSTLQRPSVGLVAKSGSKVAGDDYPAVCFQFLQAEMVVDDAEGHPLVRKPDLA